MGGLAVPRGWEPELEPGESFSTGPSIHAQESDASATSEPAYSASVCAWQPPTDSHDELHHPELSKMIYEPVTDCSAFCPTLIIHENHDATVSASSDGDTGDNSSSLGNKPPKTPAAAMPLTPSPSYPHVAQAPMPAEHAEVMPTVTYLKASHADKKAAIGQSDAHVEESENRSGSGGSDRAESTHSSSIPAVVQDCADLENGDEPIIGFEDDPTTVEDDIEDVGVCQAAASDSGIGKTKHSSDDMNDATVVKAPPPSHQVSQSQPEQLSLGDSHHSGTSDQADEDYGDFNGVPPHVNVDIVSRQTASNRISVPKGQTQEDLLRLIFTHGYIAIPSNKGMSINFYSDYSRSKEVLLGGTDCINNDLVVDFIFKL